MITATIVGTVYGIKPLENGRVAVRLRTAVQQYNRDTGNREWRGLFTTAFLPSSMVERLSEGDAVTVVADIVPRVYNGEATLELGRVHRFVRNLLRDLSTQPETAAAAAVPAVEECWRATTTPSPSPEAGKCTTIQGLLRKPLSLEML